MTAIADLVVKKYDNATNITYTALKGSGGDSDPAVWRSNSAAGYIGQRPTFQLSTRSSGDGKVRRADFKAVFPSVYTDTTTSVTQVLGQVVLTGSFAVPQGLPATDVQEAVAQFCHALSDSGVIGAVVTGFAPT